MTKPPAAIAKLKTRLREIPPSASMVASSWSAKASGLPAGKL
jgi:hypothetical protein